MRSTRHTDEMIREFTEKGHWDTITYSDLYERNAKEFPDREALVDSWTRLTWFEANQAINRIALKLVQLGFKKDDVLVCQLPNMVQLILFRVACEKAGLIIVSAVRTLRQEEMKYILKQTKAKGYVSVWKYRDFDYLQMVQEMRSSLPDLTHVFICGDEVPEGTISVAQVLSYPLEEKYSVADLQQRKLKYYEVAYVEFTSGSTGFPKVIECPLALRTYAAQSHMSRLKMTGEDIIGAFAPVSGAGRPGYHFPPFVGAKCVLVEHFDADEAMKLIEREKVTIAAIVPTQLIMMLENPNFEKYDLSSLRILNSTGAPLPFHVAQEAEERFCCHIVNHYGGIDAGSVSSCHVDDPVEIRRFAVGKPHPGNEVKLLDENGQEVSKGEIGEVWFRGPGSVGGYWDDPQLTEDAWKTGWFGMGDLAKFDELGNLIIVGRRKNVIIRGGQNIYPTEIENILQMHPKVASVAIVPIPDVVMGEKACACVVPKVGQKLILKDLVDFLREKRVAAYKFPERLELRQSMPLVSDAKLDRNKLIQDVLENLNAEGTATAIEMMLFS